MVRQSQVVLDSDNRQRQGRQKEEKNRERRMKQAKQSDR